MGVEVEESPPTMMLAALLSSFQTEECEQSVPGMGGASKRRGEGPGQVPSRDHEGQQRAHKSRQSKILDILGEKIRLVPLFSHRGTSGHPA